MVQISVFDFKPEYGHKELKLADGTRIGHLPKDPNLFLGYSTIYYGSTGSGKSTAILEELYLIKDLVDRIVTFSPTNEVNSTFNVCQPAITIHSNLTFVKIKAIYESQKKISRLYSIVNKMENLAPIFTRMKDIPKLSVNYYRALHKIHRYRQLYDEALKESNKKKMSFDEKKNFQADLSTKLGDKIRDVYKTTISEHKHVLIQNTNDVFELGILKNIDLNPNLVIIMDDCVEEIYNISKKHKVTSDEEFSMDSLFSKGRHFFITIIIAAQDDNKILPAIKKNAYVSIFTEPESANHFAESKSNAFSKSKKERFRKVIDAVFTSPSPDMANHKKLVYCMRGNQDSMFTYKIADKYNNFRVGSKDFWAECEAAQSRDPQEIDRDFVREYR